MISESEREIEFDAFFAGIFFERISGIVGPSPDFYNADYINKADRIVVELKILEKDFFIEGGVIDRFHGFVPAPVHVNPGGRGQSTFRLPEINREGKNDTFEEPMRRILKKANRQIKETKKKLLGNSGIGFLMLAANAFRSLRPDWLSRMIGELLSEEFSSIDGYILCTPGWGLVPEGADQKSPICMPNVPYGCPATVKEKCFSIGEAWCRFSDFGGHKKC